MRRLRAGTRAAVPRRLASAQRRSGSTAIRRGPAPIDFSKVVVEPLFEDEVDFDTFSKSDFRAVKVKECVAVPKSKKLLQFTLDDGTGADRVILSGIHAYYEPEELVGRTLIAITNLPAAHDDGCRLVRHAAFGHPRGAGRGRRTRGAPEPADGGRPHPRRREAVLGVLSRSDLAKS